MTDFYVGQKVVCIKGSTQLRLNAIYTVSKVQDTPYGLGIDTLECPALNWPGYLPLFFASDFRPLDERKTDISIFTKIMDDVRSKEPVAS
jgi:hypothetical protein